jgi:CRISPR/Cas system-associated protein Csx1
VSYWKTILEREIKDINEINYAKLNVIQQNIADLLQNNKLTRLEVRLILDGMKEHKMLNKEIATDIFKRNNADLIKFEGITFGLEKNEIEANK